MFFYKYFFRRVGIIESSIHERGMNIHPYHSRHRQESQNRTEARRAEEGRMSMAKRVTPEEILEMHRLYAKYGSFAAVGREIGRSGSTVAK